MPKMFGGIGRAPMVSSPPGWLFVMTSLTSFEVTNIGFVRPARVGTRTPQCEVVVADRHPPIRVVCVAAAWPALATRVAHSTSRGHAKIEPMVRDVVPMSGLTPTEGMM